MKTFTRNLRERAKHLELSHAEVARRCGLTERRLGHYMTGTREPDFATLLKICAVLDTSPSALLGVEGPVISTGEAGSLRAAIAAGIASLTVANLRAVKALIDSMIAEQRTAKGRRAASS